MPGPGGGSRGGGGHRGGSFGGGHRPGGSFGGHRPVHRPHHTRPYMGGGWYGPRRSYGGGGCGCLGGAISLVLIPFAMVLAIMLALLGSCSDDIYYDDGYVSIGGYYDEEKFQDYADGQYAKAFGHLETYEDNLLLVILTEEDNYSYSWIAWVGDHITTDINWLFGAEDTVLGEVLEESVDGQNYKYSLDSNLADAMKMMTTEIKHLNLESSFDCTEERVAFDSHLVNNTDLPMTAETVNDALAYFTEQTGIPVVIVVEDAEGVFGTTVTEDVADADTVPDTQEWSISGSIVPVVAVILLAAVVIVVLRNYKKQNSGVDFETAERNKKYSEFDDYYK